MALTKDSGVGVDNGAEKQLPNGNWRVFALLSAEKSQSDSQNYLQVVD